MKVPDQYGTNWLVARGDPAHGAVQTCLKAGIPAPILPRHILAGWSATGPFRLGPPPTGNAFLRWCTLRDSLLAASIDYVIG